MTGHVPPVSIVQLTGVGDERLVLDFYRSVLLPNFRPDELVTEDELISSLRSGSCRITIAQDAGGAVIGGIVGDWFPDSRVQLLSYIAVHPGVRGQGVGTSLLNTAIAGWVADLAPLLVIGEVEDPRHYHGTEFGDPVARVRLYERFGARSLPVSYSQPALRSGSARVPHLLLMVFAADPAARIAAGRVDGRIVGRFLTEYFAATEGPVCPDDSELEAILRACSEPGGLPLLLAEQLRDLG
jgi:GNAT superfamily N-acetyltransferase